MSDTNNAILEIYEDAADEWRWRLIHGEDERNRRAGRDGRPLRPALAIGDGGRERSCLTRSQVTDPV
jgi:hypothetical protein